MKNKREYNFSYIILFTFLNFIAVSCYVALKFVAFFVISSEQTEAPERGFVKRKRQNLKTGTLCFKKTLFKIKGFAELPFCIATVFSAKI